MNVFSKQESALSFERSLVVLRVSGVCACINTLSFDVLSQYAVLDCLHKMCFNPK